MNHTQKQSKELAHRFLVRSLIFGEREYEQKAENRKATEKFAKAPRRNLGKQQDKP